MKRICFVILSMLGLMPVARIRAQADVSMATHWSNRSTYNPAFITRTDYLYLYSNVRKQWMGVNGAPEVLNVQVSQYFQSMRSALGFFLMADKIGVSKTVNPMATYAFRIARKEGWQLSMGLSAGLYTKTINGSLFEAEDTDDPNLFYYIKRKTDPDINAGVEYQNLHFIYGLSSTHLFSMGKADTIYRNSSHRYIYAIYKNEQPRLFSYSLGVQVINNLNETIVEGNFSFRLKHQPRLMEGVLLRGAQELLDVGFTCRSSRQMTVNAGLMLTNFIRIGYAYDQSLFSRFAFNPTHEIVIEYRIPARSASPVVRCGSKEYWYH